MKKMTFFKCIIASAAMILLMAGTCFAEGLQSQTGFPFTVNLGMDSYEKLCYAGHVPGGGMFYDDGYMITPAATFSISPRYGTDTEMFGNLSVEIDLIYENSDNTSCVKEVIRKHDFGDVQAGKQYPILSETALKSLKQRKKLYSSDVMSLKMIMTYRSEGGNQKKQAFLFYLAKDDEYNDKKNVLAAPPETE